MPNPLEYLIQIKNQGTAAFSAIQADIKATTAASKAANADILQSDKATKQQQYTISKAQYFANIENKKREAAEIYAISKAQYQAHAENEARKVAASKAANDAIVAASAKANAEMLANLRATGAAASAAGVPGGMLLGRGASILTSPAGLTVAGGVALVTVLGALAAATKSFGDQIQRVDNISAATGLSTTKIQILQEVAKETGVEFGSLSTAVVRFQATLGKGEGLDEYGESTSKLRKKLQDLGIDTRQGALETMVQFKDMLDQVGDREKAQQILLDALGIRAKALAPLLLNVNVNLRQMMEAIGKTNVVVSDEGIQNARILHDIWAGIARSVESSANWALEFIARTIVGGGGQPGGRLPIAPWKYDDSSSSGLRLKTAKDLQAEARAKFESAGMAPVDVKIMQLEADEKKKVTDEDWAGAAAIKERIKALKEQQSVEQKSADVIRQTVDKFRVLYGDIQGRFSSIHVYDAQGREIAPIDPGTGLPMSNKTWLPGQAAASSAAEMARNIPDLSKSLETQEFITKITMAVSAVKATDIGLPQREEGTIYQGLSEKNAQAVQALRDMADQGKEAGRLIQQGAEQFKKETEQMGGRLFDALWRGQTGMVDLIKSLAMAPAKKVFENIFGLAFGSVAGKAGGLIGGQVQKDANGNVIYDDSGRPKLTKLGEILKGTPLGADTAKLQADLIIKNAADRHAQHQTTNDLLQKIADVATAPLTGSNGGSLGTVGTLIGLGGILAGAGGGTNGGGFGALINQGFGGKGPFGIGTGGGGLGGPFTPDAGWGGFKAGLGSPSSVWEAIGLNNTGTSSPNGLSTAQQAGSIVSALGVVGTGAMTAKAGFQRGGVGGDAQGVAAIAGTAAALDPEPVSKAVLAGVALVAGIVSAIAGDSVKKRNEQIATTIAGEKFYANQPIFGNRQFALGGFEESNMHAGPYGIVAPGSQQENNGAGPTAGHTFNVTIHALDMNSIRDRIPELTDMFATAMTGGRAPQFRQAMREAN